LAALHRLGRCFGAHDISVSSLRRSRNQRTAMPITSLVFKPVSSAPAYPGVP
jgi:hypothetical protein